mmetsp:Transcript_52843/g.141541  ORF Transcript_52843/g.141541 Transcript_52843/m.141541 type:complete len:286 (-) Transcript_52843:230-1087(-)
MCVEPLRPDGGARERDRRGGELLGALRELVRHPPANAHRGGAQLLALQSLPADLLVVVREHVPAPHVGTAHETVLRRRRRQVAYVGDPGGLTHVVEAFGKGQGVVDAVLRADLARGGHAEQVVGLERQILPNVFVLLVEVAPLGHQQVPAVGAARQVDEDQCLVGLPARADRVLDGLARGRRRQRGAHRVELRGHGGGELCGLQLMACLSLIVCQLDNGLGGVGQPAAREQDVQLLESLLFGRLSSIHQVALRAKRLAVWALGEVHVDADALGVGAQVADSELDH